MRQGSKGTFRVENALYSLNDPFNPIEIAPNATALRAHKPNNHLIQNIFSRFCAGWLIPSVCDAHGSIRSGPRTNTVQNNTARCMRVRK